MIQKTFTCMWASKTCDWSSNFSVKSYILSWYASTWNLMNQSIILIAVQNLWFKGIEQQNKHIHTEIRGKRYGSSKQYQEQSDITLPLQYMSPFDSFLFCLWNYPSIKRKRGGGLRPFIRSRSSCTAHFWILVMWTWFMDPLAVDRLSERYSDQKTYM